MKGILITTSGEFSTVELKEPLYESAGKLLGGRIEQAAPLRLEGLYRMIVNGEGGMLGLPEKRIGYYFYEMDEEEMPLYGDVVILKDKWTPDGVVIAGLEEADIASVVEILEDALAEACCG